MKHDYEILLEIFNKVDLIGVADEVPDEYDPEVRKILSEIPAEITASKLRSTIKEVLIRQFNQAIATRNGNDTKIFREMMDHRSQFSFKIIDG